MGNKLCFTTPELTVFFLKFNNYAKSSDINIDRAPEHNIQLCMERFIAEEYGEL